MSEFFRQLVIDHLKQSGMSQSELSRRSGMAQPKLNAYLRGHKVITDTTLENLLRALDVDLDSL